MSNTSYLSIIAKNPGEAYAALVLGTNHTETARIIEERRNETAEIAGKYAVQVGYGSLKRTGEAIFAKQFLAAQTPAEQVGYDRRTV